MMTIENHTESFYVTGGTLRRDAACYVQRRADQALYDGLLQGKFCYVLTSRQMGKSSLMVRTAARLREAGVHVAVLDLTSIGQNLSAEQWYDGLLARVGQQFNLEDELEDFWLANPRLSPLLRWMKAIREVVLPRLTGRIVIFVDEIDAVRSLPFSTDEFFAAIRELYNRRTEEAELERLTFCLLGVASPSDLIRDTRTTPFNIGQRIELNDFTDDEAEPLARGLGREDKTATKLLKRILYWTGGHPYLTQRLCQAVAADAQIKDVGGIDRLCDALFFTTRARETDDNLLFVREQILRGEADKAALLDLYAQVRAQKRIRDDETNPLVTVLRLSGITRVVEGLLYVRNRIYYRVFDREWVLANLPDAEVQRQKAAYRRGVMRTATIAAVMLAVVSGLALLAFWQRNRAVESEKAKQSLLYAAQMNTAGEDLENNSLGRIHTLLNNHLPQPGEADPRGFEWFYLWKASHRDLLTVRHGRTVTTVAFAPDGKRFATGSQDATVKIWDATTGKELLTIKTPVEVWGLSYSPDGTKIAVTGDNQLVRLWDATTGQEISSLEPASPLTSPTDTRLANFSKRGTIWAVAFSPNGKLIAAGNLDSAIRLFDVDSRKESAILQGHLAPVRTVSFAADGQKLASLSFDGTIKIWDVNARRALLTITGSPDAWGNGMAFSPDGRLVALGSNSNLVFVWDAITGKKLFDLKGHGTGVPGLKFSPDGKTLASGSGDTTIRFWDMATGQELNHIKGHAHAITSLDFSPDGTKIVTGSVDQTAKLWTLSANDAPSLLTGHSSFLVSVVFSPDGKKLLSTSWDNSAKVWDVATGRQLLSLQKHTNWLYRGVFSPDGTKIATASEDQTVRIWEANTGQELMVLKHAGPVYLVAFTPDGKSLFSSGQEGIARQWNMATGKEVTSFKDESGYIDVIDVSPDGKLLAWSNGDGHVKVIEPATGKELLKLKGWRDDINLVAFSPDSQAILTAPGDSTLRLWEIKTGRELTKFQGHSGTAYGAAFSPDGKRLVTGGADNTVKIWNVATGQDLLTLRGHTHILNSVAFSPDGQTIASASADKTIRLWRAATAAEVQARRGQ